MNEHIDRLNAALQGRYTIQRELGSGGMATVYLAEDLKHRRQVAIKVLDPELARALGAERFLREVEVTANLNHPHILPLHDSGEADGFLFYVMPYVEGETLRERMNREGQLPLDDALQITRQVAAALSYAHSHAVIHRDIKPENVLLSAGEAVVADFGIARAITAAGAEHLTETGISIGTPAYMSPEQGAGSGELDGRSDIYSLGCVLYEMLSGDAPYTASTPQAVIAKKLSEPTPRISVVRESVQPGVAAALTKALAKTAADRFQTASAFAEALTSEMVVARVDKRRWTRLAVAAPVTLIVLAAVVWGYLTFLGGSAYERLAVLPPVNLMNDPEQEYFVQGVHTALISELQRAGVPVIARTSVLQYEDTQKRIREIAQELDVDALVELSVFRAGDSLEAEVLLVDGDTEEYVAEPITRGGQLRDVMTLYRNLSRAIAAEIQASLTPQAEAILASAREVDPQVYEDYLRGQFHFERLTPSSLEAALEWYERALRRDSTYALAYVGIANVWEVRAMMGTESIREAHLQSSTAVRKAWELDSTLPEVQGTAASIRMSQEWDWAGAETAYRRVIELNPNDPVARQSYANLLAILGRPEEARAEMDRAVALDPSNGILRLFNGSVFMSERRYEDAVAEYRRARELVSFGIVPVWDALDLNGALAEAFAELRRWVAEDTEDEEVLDGLDRGYAEGGYRAACRRGADILAARRAATSAVWVGSYSVASWYASAREKELTLEWLERAYEEHNPGMPWVGADPLLDFVRDEPRFRDLLRRMNLPQR